MPSQQTYVFFAFGLFLLATAIEFAWMKHRNLKYPWQNLFSTLGIGLGQRFLGAFSSTATIAIFSQVEQLRIIPLSMSRPVHWIALFLLFELAYYWFHRASHRIHWIWATHQVHHSSERLYLPAALRLGWTGFFSMVWLFWLPLILLGFPAKAVMVMLAINLLYQFVLHTEAVPKLGILEKIFNTPSHHRVHHGCNPEYIDCNYGGIVIIYDRIFGTFVQESSSISIRYGLTDPIDSKNPLKLALTGWANLLSTMIKTNSIYSALKIALAPPGPARGVNPAPGYWVHCAGVVVPVLVASYLSEIYKAGWFLLPAFFHFST